MASQTRTPEAEGVKRDLEAGRLLRELREDLFLSRDEMPRAMRKAKIPEDYVPGAKTLWRIEHLGTIPCERYRFGLARFHDRTVRSIWSDGESAGLMPLEREALA